MKKTILFPAALLAAIVLAACSGNPRSVQNPLIASANTRTIDIVGIDLTDTLTTLHVEAYQRPHYWIRIAGESYLRAGDKRYALVGAEGITIDSLFWMPDSGRASFLLRFEPLPLSTRSFDFIESDDDNAWRLYGVDLTGKTAYDPFPAGFPKDLRKKPADGPLPDPVMAGGRSTVRLHLLGWQPGMSPELKLYVNTLLSGQEEHILKIDPATSEAEVTFDQWGPAQAFIVDPAQYSLGAMWLAPGETTEVWTDMSQSGRWLYRRRNGGDDTSVGYAPFRTRGTYAALNAMDAECRWRVSLETYNGTFADYAMDADAYTAMLVDRYRTLSDSIARSDQPQMMRELNEYSLRQETLNAIADADYFLRHNYWHIHNSWGEPVPEGTITAQFGPQHYAAVGRLFDAGDPKMLMGDNVSDYQSALLVKGIDWCNYGAQGALTTELPQAERLAGKAANLQLDDDDRALLASFSEPLYAEACLGIEKSIRERMAALDEVRFETTPDVPVEKLFEAIVAPYKGKVVFVDFWNTWCGPCRAALKANEPLKEGALKSDDLVWVYIANETSPLVKYKEMIPGIAGKHFRLNAEQWSYLCDYFNVDGIPSYVVVDRDGRAALRNDLRDHSLLVKVLQEMLQ